MYQILKDIQFSTLSPYKLNLRRKRGNSRIKYIHYNVNIKMLDDSELNELWLDDWEVQDSMLDVSPQI